MKTIINIVLFGCLLLVLNSLTDDFLIEKYEMQLEGLGSKEEILKVNEQRNSVNRSKNENFIYLLLMLIMILVFNLKYNQITKYISSKINFFKKYHKN